MASSGHFHLRQSVCGSVTTPTLGHRGISAWMLSFDRLTLGLRLVALQQCHHLVVLDLTEVVVVLADGVEGGVDEQADDDVRFLT